nr:hypothetical protein [uncultured Stomatobaculum sp.]
MMIEKSPSRETGAKPALNPDHVLVFISLLFMIVPVICFLWGWTRPYIALIGSVALMYLLRSAYRELKQAVQISITSNPKFWLTAFAIISLWCLLSGIGGYSYQTIDFMARNPMFHDLCNEAWPLRFSLAEQPGHIQNLFPNATICDFVYYFSWWLPVAACVKVFHLPYLVAETLLLLYATTEVCLIFYCLTNVIKKQSYLVLSAFMLFGGYDFWITWMGGIPSMMTKGFPGFFINDIEWWTCRFSYSANTTQLFYVFNSSLPMWMLACLLLLLPKHKNRAALGSLAFAYSPFGTVAFVVIVLADIFRGAGKAWLTRIKEAVSIQNLVIPLLMLVVYGSFYLQVDLQKSSSVDGFLFSIYPERKTFTLYILFLLAEVWVYFIAIGKNARKLRYYWTTLLGLSLIPLMKVGWANDWALKVSIPLLFLLVVIILESYYRETEKRRRYIILGVLFLGYLTSAMELQRNIYGTLTIEERDCINSFYPSFKYMGSESEERDTMLAGQYFAPEDDSFWLKYISPINPAEK